MKKGIRIAVDVDEVLTPFVGTMMSWKPPKKSLSKFYPYLYRKIWDITEEESTRMVRDFYETEEFSKLQPMKDSVEVLGRLKNKGATLYVMTGRQDCVRQKTEKWVETNFPGIFTDVVLTNSFTPQEISKEYMCNVLHIGLIIDDNIQTCVRCFDKGTSAINFIGDPMYPWCYPNRISVKSWRDISNETL